MGVAKGEAGIQRAPTQANLMEEEIMAAGSTAIPYTDTAEYTSAAKGDDAACPYNP
jgi:hypothetical protein